MLQSFESNPSPPGFQALPRVWILMGVHGAYLSDEPLAILERDLPPALQRAQAESVEAVMNELTPQSRWFPAPLLLALLSSCSGPRSMGGQTGAEKLGCIDVDSEALSLHEISPGGFSAAELMETLGSTEDTPRVIRGAIPFKYEANAKRAGSTSLRVSLDAEGSVALWVEREWRASEDDGGTEIAVDGPEPRALCTSGLRLQANLGLETEDGAFVASWGDVALLSDSASIATLNHVVAASDLGGDYPFADESANPQLLVALYWHGAELSGKLMERTTREGEGAADDGVSGQTVVIGTFGTPPTDDDVLAPSGIASGAVALARVSVARPPAP